MSRLSNLISWLKNGFIAYSSNTKGHNLYLTYLENIDGQLWQLAPPQGLDIRPDSTHSPELTLVLWSNLSTDLAVADVHGNFYILLAGVGLLNNTSATSSNSASSNGTTNGATTKTNGSSANGSANSSSGSNNGTVKASPSYELTSYNHMEMIYRDIVDDKSTIHTQSALSIISFKWLDIEKPQIINKPAQAPKALEPYSYLVGQYQPHGVTHPISTKQAGFALRKNGELILFYQGEHKVEYHKLSVELPLDGPLSLSLASIGVGNDKQVIVCAFDGISQKILTFVVGVDWGFLVESARKQKVDPHYHTPKEMQKAPKLVVSKVQEMLPIGVAQSREKEETKTDVLPKPEDTYNDTYIKKEFGDRAFIKKDEDHDMIKDEILDVSSISSIDVISASGEPTSKPEIIISYSSRSTTTMYRYHLSSESDLVSDAFADLGMRLGVQQTPPDITQILVLQDELTRNGELLSICTGVALTFLLMQYKSGRIDVLDRSKMRVINNKKEGAAPAEISSIFDVGFEFPRIRGDNLIMTISPNMTSLVYLKGDTLQIEVVEKVRFLGASKAELLLSSVGFAFRHAYACYTNTCADDLIVLIQTEILRVNAIRQGKNEDSKEIRDKSLDSIGDTDISLQQFLQATPHLENTAKTPTIPEFIQMILIESHRAINFHLHAFNKESVDKLLSNPPLQKLLSLQLILGEIQSGYESSVDSPISDISWIVLNLRSASFGVMFLLLSIYRQISKKKPTEDSLQDSITRGECIVSLIGNINWLIDVMVYLNQELLQLSIAKKNPNSTRLNVHNSLVLPLILSKVPRLFLMYALSLINKTHEILKKLHKDLLELNKLLTPMKESLSRCFTIVNNSPLTLAVFENYLKESDALILREFSIIGKDKNILELEQKLVCQGQLDDDMVRIAETLIDRHSASISRDIKVSELYFYDVDWLNIGVNASRDLRRNALVLRKNQSVVPRLPYSKDECVDSLRKIIIHMGGERKLRRCTRCRSVLLVMDMLVFDAPGTIGLWTMVFQRTCICGNPWVNI